MGKTKQSTVKIKKRKTKSVVVESFFNVCMQSFEEIIKKIFAAHGIFDVIYKYNEHNQNDNRIDITIPAKLYNENKEKIDIISKIVQHAASFCDLENKIHPVLLTDERVTTKFPPLNTIEISETFAKKLQIHVNEHINLFDLEKGIFKICSVKYNNNLEDEKIALTASLRNQFAGSSHLFIQKRMQISFQTVRVQGVNDILDGYITISDTYKEWLEKSKATKIEIVNEITGSSLDIPIAKVKFAPLDEKIIKLNYFQRLVLETDLPKDLMPYYYKKFAEKLRSDDEKKTLLEKYYSNGKALSSEIINEEIDRFNFKRRVMNVLRGAGYPVIKLYPLTREKPANGNIFRRIVNRLLQIIIGTHPINLKAIRPYETDESTNAIRLTKSTMELLGVDESDNVMITYRNKTVKARALLINEIESIKETNIFQTESEINACIGIPAHLRAKLGMPKINICCQVERDQRYLFRKNLNIQFISIIAVFLTLTQVLQKASTIAIIAVLFGIPISVYIIFSSVRNRIKSR